MFKLEGVALLTGATGFIGQHFLTNLLSQKDLKTWVISRQAPKFEHPNLTWIQKPLEQISTSDFLKLEGKALDYVFHLGAFIPKSRSENDIEAIYQSNLYGTRALYEALSPPVSKLIFASTVDVYPDVPNSAIDENSQIAPVSLYGASKFFGEQLTHSYATKLQAIPVILRYGHIYGAGEFAYQKLIPELIRKMLKGESIILQGDGSALRDFLYVEDLVRLTLCAAANITSDVGPINLVSGQSISIKTLAEKMAKLLNFKGKLDFDLCIPRGRSLKFDNSKMKLILGDVPLTPLDQGLKNECAEFSALMGLI